MADDDSGVEGGTGFGGSEETGFSETGIYSSPNVQAYTNEDLGADRFGNNVSEYARTVEAGHMYNQANMQHLKPGGGIPAGMNLNAPLPGMTPMTKPDRANPTTQAVQPPQEQPKKEEEKRPQPGDVGHPIISKGPEPYDNHLAVQRNRYPFEPVVPIAGSGVKRAFFNEQTDLLKALFPYYK